MGGAKQSWLETQERGWSEPDKCVCPDCVEDDFLKDVIRENACQRMCDYCGHRTRSFSAAPVEVLMEPIARTVFFYYNDPTDACVPYDGGCFIFDPTHTDDVLMELGLECNDELFNDISEAFVNFGWVPAANGHWASSHEHEILSYSWSSFVEIVKHNVRFFFLDDPDSCCHEYEEYEPRRLLQAIGRMVNELSLVKQLPAGTMFFRVRERHQEDGWALDADQLGAPPAQLARAGRMNPAGISYFYLAFEQQTALCEVLQCPPCSAAVASFNSQQELSVLDLSSLPELPSIFDHASRDVREALLFLRQFVEEISKPIRKDGQEHIEYVPSQVISEYFALIFRHAEDRHLDGILYPSAIRPGGRNLLLFPSNRGYERNFDQVIFLSAQEMNFADWSEFSAAITVRS